jgi:hypothetical protein
LALQSFELVYRKEKYHYDYVRQRFLVALAVRADRLPDIVDYGLQWCPKLDASELFEQETVEQGVIDEQMVQLYLHAK